MVGTLNQAYDPVEQRFDDAELNDFLEHRDVVSVAEHLFVHEQLPTWALMVTWRATDILLNSR